MKQNILYERQPMWRGYGLLVYELDKHMWSVCRDNNIEITCYPISVDYEKNIYLSVFGIIQNVV